MNRTCVIFSSVCFIAIIGCAKDDSAKHALSKSDRDALRAEFSHPAGGRVQTGSKPIVQGTLPLALLVRGGNSVWVLDVASGFQVAAGATDRDAILSVNAKTGVTLAGRNIAPGPLASADTYAIYVEPAPDK